MAGEACCSVSRVMRPYMAFILNPSKIYFSFGSRLGLGFPHFGLKIRYFSPPSACTHTPFHLSKCATLQASYHAE
jgi:hypothetical protein